MQDDVSRLVGIDVLAVTGVHETGRQLEIEVELVTGVAELPSGTLQPAVPLAARGPAAEEQRICEKRRQPGRSLRRLTDEFGRPHSTVHRVLQRAGCSRQPRPECPAVVRYEWPWPRKPAAHGYQETRQVRSAPHAVTGNRIQRSRRVGWEFVHSIVDDCSRLAYSEIHDDEQAATVTAFVARALAFFSEHGIAAERCMTDNAWAYIHNRSLRGLPDGCTITHIRTRPYTPRTNGKVERYTNRPCSANGPTPCNTPQAKPDATRCHTGCATTTSDAPTARSATALPSNAFGRSPGSTSSSAHWLCRGQDACAVYLALVARELAPQPGFQTPEQQRALDARRLGSHVPARGHEACCCACHHRGRERGAESLALVHRACPAHRIVARTTWRDDEQRRDVAITRFGTRLSRCARTSRPDGDDALQRRRDRDTWAVVPGRGDEKRLGRGSEP